MRNAPIDRDMRLCEGFLWLPKRGAGEWRWLEWARWLEQYIVGTRSTGWFVREWIDKPKQATPADVLAAFAEGVRMADFRSKPDNETMEAGRG